MANTKNLRPPWKPGQSGNPGGRPKKRPVSDELAALLNAKGGKEAKRLAEVILREALKGDIAFVKELLTRIEGKPPDDVSLNDGPTKIVVEYLDRPIDPAAQDAAGDPE